jgi:hypothetical protein
VAGALVLIGVGIALLTYFYWRHTRPREYMSALDALADVEQSVPRDSDVPTSEQPAVGPSATAAAAGGTTAVKILDEPKVADEAPRPVEAKATEPAVADPTPTVLDEPTQITTLEDLNTPDASDKD